jgi:hypothetical protein
MSSTRLSRVASFGARSTRLARFAQPRMPTKPSVLARVSLATVAPPRIDDERSQHDDRRRRRRRRWSRNLVVPILFAPVVGVASYVFLRVWPTQDDAASQQRHSFIETDSHVDLPPLRAEFSWHAKDRYTMYVLCFEFCSKL